MAPVGPHSAGRQEPPSLPDHAHSTRSPGRTQPASEETDMERGQKETTPQSPSRRPQPPRRRHAHTPFLRVRVQGPSRPRSDQRTRPRPRSLEGVSPSPSRRRHGQMDRERHTYHRAPETSPRTPCRARSQETAAQTTEAARTEHEASQTPRSQRSQDIRRRTDTRRRQRTPQAEAIDLPETGGAPQFQLDHKRFFRTETETEEIALLLSHPAHRLI